MHNEIVDYWQELLFVMQAMPLDTIVKAAEMLLACYQRGNTVFTLGNGGSAATASHFACDLAKGTKAFPAFRVISLSDNVSLLTAWANDTSYERVFAEQLASLVRSDDVVVAMSVSGNSPNVLAAASVAQQSGAITIALTDQSGGKLSQLADLAICVPSQAIEQVENAHLIITHSLCALLRQRLCTSSIIIEQAEPSVTSAFS
ncbi:MAG: SIS domain-containing protein [Ktedonobacteraceae bacterium]|nr:SIS domain-containing protein [Ktedonobacteraceae bacterium]